MKTFRLKIVFSNNDERNGDEVGLLPFPDFSAHEDFWKYEESPTGYNYYVQEVCWT